MFVRPGSKDPTTAYSCSTVRFACWRAVIELNGLKDRVFGFRFMMIFFFVEGSNCNVLKEFEVTLRNAFVLLRFFLCSSYATVWLFLRDIITKDNV